MSIKIRLCYMVDYVLRSSIFSTSIPSCKQRPYKERLVNFLQIKEQRLVYWKKAKERVPYFYQSEFLR